MGFFSGSDAVKPLPSVLETDRESTLTIRGAEYHIAFDLSEITPRLRKKLKAIREEGKTEGSEDALIEYIAQVLTGWDVPDKSGTVLPLTVEGVSSLTYAALNAIADAINAAVPNETAGAAPTGSAASAN